VIAPAACGRCGSADLEISRGIVCLGRRAGGCQPLASARCRACGALYAGGGEWLSRNQAEAVAAGRPLVEQAELPL
jgi:hypothetical protein